MSDLRICPSIQTPFTFSLMTLEFSFPALEGVLAGPHHVVGNQVYSKGDGEFDSVHNLNERMIGPLIKSSHNILMKTFPPTVGNYH